MALDQSALLELLGELKLTGTTDRIRAATERLYQELIDAETAAFIGAAPYERTSERTTTRNGSRPRVLSTTAGDLELRIPKLRQGSFFPSLLERRRRVDQALFAVVMEAYLHGVSTRKVDDLVKALGADTGISKSEVSRICQGLDAEVASFRDRSLSDIAYPYVFLDATYCKVRIDHRVVSQAVVVAIGVAADGRRVVLGFDVGDSETEEFWKQFLRSLKTRGLGGVKLVISDAHAGLKKAAATVLQGAAWQRCRVHFMRNALAHAGKSGRRVVSAFIATAFAQETPEAASQQWRSIADQVRPKLPKLATLMDDAEPDVLAYMTFPREHRAKLHSTNPIERLNGEIKRRTEVVGIFPNEAAITRLVGAILMEQSDEWAVQRARYMTLETMAPLSDNPIVMLSAVPGS